MTVRGGHHTEETKQRIRETKRHEKNRAPLVPQLCACGCGGYAAVDERRNRVSTYISGHNGSRRGQRTSDEARAKLASYTGERASNYKHGWAGTPTYVSWHAMVGRCTDPRNASYEHYSSRGITVCERWLDFLNFLADMGPRPSLDHSIDRYPNSHLVYEPGWCRWATKQEQADNRDPSNGWDARRANQG